METTLDSKVFLILFVLFVLEVIPVLRQLIFRRAIRTIIKKEGKKPFGVVFQVNYVQSR